MTNIGINQRLVGDMGRGGHVCLGTLLGSVTLC